MDEQNLVSASNAGGKDSILRGAAYRRSPIADLF